MALVTTRKHACVVMLLLIRVLVALAQVAVAVGFDHFSPPNLHQLSARTRLGLHKRLGQARCAVFLSLLIVLQARCLASALIVSCRRCSMSFGSLRSWFSLRSARVSAVVALISCLVVLSRKSASTMVTV